MTRPARAGQTPPATSTDTSTDTSATMPGTADTAASTGPARDLTAHIAYLTRVIRTPTIAAVWQHLATQARAEGWSHEEYLATVLARQVAAREANGTALRCAGAHFPAIKTLEDFNPDHQPSLRRDTLAHLATCTFIPTAGNAILLGPPGVGKTHLAIGLGIKAVQAGHRVLFDTATGWVTRLRTAHDEARLPAELRRLSRYQLLIIDEIGYIPFDPSAANLFFQLISSRYEQGSVLARAHAKQHRPPIRDLGPRQQRAAMAPSTIVHANQFRRSAPHRYAARRRSQPWRSGHRHYIEDHRRKTSLDGNRDGNTQAHQQTWAHLAIT